MLRHYTLTASSARLSRVPWIDEVGLVHRPRFDIGPGQRAPIVYKKRRGSLVLTSARWGLVPSWADRPSVGHRLPAVGIEEADSTPAFQSAFRVRRCLLPADGFFKWQEGEEGGSRLYWYHRPDRSVFALAGLWEEWISRETRESLRTFAMVTRSDPEEDLSSSTDRWPVILDGTSWNTWMNLRVPTGELSKMVAESDPGSLVARAVSPDTLMRGDGGPEMIEPV